MKKRPDRIFHLSIAVVAILITCISVWSITQSLPPAVQKHISGLTTTSVLSGQGSHFGSRAPNSTSNALVNASVNGWTSRRSRRTAAASADLKRIEVVADGSHVTAANVNRVKSMLGRVDSPALIEQSLGLKMKKPAVIEVVSGANDYKNALLKLGVSPHDAGALSTSSGGFTQNSTIVLPIDENADDTDLANTLTHELTHVYINQNVGPLPSWLNEGIAVFMGMRGQKRIESAVTFAGDERQFAENILDVSESHQLQPLSGNEEAILSGKTSYDYELQDWLAVSDLIDHHGIRSVRRYLNLVSRHLQSSQAFIDAFGERQDIFNKDFNGMMQIAAGTKDAGAKFTFSVSTAYHGNIGLLQHSESAWQVVRATAGEHVMAVGSNGSLSSDLSQVKSLVGNSPSDNHTLYISLLPSSPLYYHGHRVTDSGFAFDVHNGLYAFQNSWITLDTGDTTYLSVPRLFGVSIQSVAESNASNPLVALFGVE